MIGHVVSGADVVRLSIHVNTWLLPDFNHQDGNGHNYYEVDINVGDDNGDCGGLDDDGILHLLLTLAMTIPREYEDDHQEREYEAAHLRLIQTTFFCSSYFFSAASTHFPTSSFNGWPVKENDAWFWLFGEQQFCLNWSFYIGRV